MEQLASGRRVNRLSDDPATAALSVEHRYRLGETDQFLRNIADISSLTRTTETALNEVVTALSRATTLGVQGGTDTISAENRAVVAAEVRSLQQRLVALGNTEYQGKYIFAGTEVNTQPFALDGSIPSGVRYDGNTTTNFVEVAPGQMVKAHVLGSDVFTNPSADVFLALETLATALESGTSGQIQAATSQVRSAFEHVTNERAVLGAGLASLESAELFLQRERVDLAIRQEELVAADLATSATNLIQARSVREAVLAAAGRISSLSLFDFLR
jgi:flagellar hook-associated protein 3 FlgL